MTFTTDDAARLAASLLGVAGTATALAGERDRSFRIDAADGARYVLKVHAADTDLDGLAFEDAAIAAVGTPALVRSTTTADGRAARLLTWVDGTLWADAGPWEPALLRELGRHVARVDRALAAVEHPAMRRPHRWNMVTAPELDPTVRVQLDALPWQPIHNDANEHNVLVTDDRRIAGLIDFGDTVHAPRICGLAVACAYAMLGQRDPVRAILPLLAGYHAECPLDPAELAVLDALIRTRLAMSVANAAAQLVEHPDNPYLAISQAPVAALRAILEGESPELAHLRFRDACGYRAVPTERAVVSYLSSAPAAVVPVIRLEGGRPGGYREPRTWYGGDAFATTDPAERRTIHVGIDVWHPAGEPVRAPLVGVVEGAEHRPDHLDFGGIVILRHRTADGDPFWTLYGHLARGSVEGVEPGRVVQAGEVLGVLGDESENGGWEPHLHFQLNTTLLGMGTGMHGVAAPSELDVWESISPDPNLILRAAEARPAVRDRTPAEILRRRRANFSAALSISYREPLAIVGGEGAYLVDEEGGRWLDLVNNVCHVGHANPRVVAALADQAAVLNTNTRYLHPTLVEYGRRLLATFPDPLSVLLLTNSGSAANDLALRLARAHTGRHDVLCLDWAYHGNLTSTIDISPYKFNRPGGRGCPPTTRICEVPDPYRGRFGPDGPAYAEDVRTACAERDAAAFIAESLPGCAGQLELAPGYLEAAFAHARAAGVVCIADEVQVGFGRVGTHFWGFETQGVVPDIVTMGKPIGNGHPIGAVVCSPRIARSFETGMEYFNTFGGNPVSAAVGLAVLDELRDGRLQARAEDLGERFIAGLRAVQARHELVGDVRGRGLYLGVELVLDRATKEPATAAAAAVKEVCKAHGVLLSTDGPDDNVLKIKPPLVLNEADVDRAVDAIDAGLTAAAGR
jgi:4-aminobutyrate aminotransferase-like enzyme/Ser/Thr protein kinase RdoA (MazF antagonist)